MKDLIVIALLVYVIILLHRTSSGYSGSSAGNSSSGNPWATVISFTTLETGDKIVGMLVDQLQEQPCLSNVNSIISYANATLTNKLVPYTDESQIAKMFATADSIGESTLSYTDKFMLRVSSVFGQEVQGFCGLYGLPACKIDSNGKVQWADEIFAQTGKNLKENMIQVFKMMQVGNIITDDSVANVINPILPAGLTPFTSGADYLAKLGTDDPRMIWFKKFFMIGPLFLYWKAKTVWKLDPSFVVS
jgi:hypothetical protein